MNQFIDNYIVHKNFIIDSHQINLIIVATIVKKHFHGPKYLKLFILAAFLIIYRMTAKL